MSCQGQGNRFIQKALDNIQISPLTEHGVTNTVHTPENRSRRMAYDIVPARSFIAIIDREIIPVSMVHCDTITRLNRQIWNVAMIKLGVGV